MKQHIYFSFFIVFIALFSTCSLAATSLQTPLQVPLKFPVVQGSTLSLQSIPLGGSIASVLASPNAPNVTNIVLASSSGTNQDADNLTVSFTITDPNADRITGITDWRKNGQSIAVVNMPFDTNVTSLAQGAIADYSSFHNNATITGIAPQPQWVSNGRAGGAYIFNQYYYLTIPNNPSLYTPKFTAMAWVKPGTIFASSQYANLFKKDRSYILRFIGDPFNPGSPTYLYGYVFPSGGYTSEGNTSIIINSTLGTFTPNTWYHVALSYDGAVLALYIDGVLNNQIVQHAVMENANNPLLIGGASGEQFAGLMDEALVFNRALSPEQIKDIYNEGLLNRSFRTLVGNETIGEDQWNVAVTPNDAKEDGNTGLSNTLTILGQSAECAPIPRDGCIVSRNNTFAKGNYNLPRGLTIIANNVTLDCNGSLIYGNNTVVPETWSSGIYSIYRSRVTVKNCKVENYTNGITFLSGENNNVVNNTLQASWVSGGLKNGVWTSGVNGTAIVNNTFIHQGMQITEPATNNIIASNKIYGAPRFGIYISGTGFRTGFPQKNSIIYNTIIGTGENTSAETSAIKAINIDNDNLTIAYNTINNTWGTAYGVGIALYQSAYARIENNSFYNNNWGIVVYKGTNNLIKNNVAKNDRNADVGLQGYSWGNTVTNNTLSDTSTGIAFSLTESNYTENQFNYVAYNKILNTTMVGIYVYPNETNSTFSNNFFLNNTIWGDPTQRAQSFTVGIYNYANSPTIHHNTIKGNTIFNTSYGIYFYRSHNNSIAENTVYDNDVGVYFGKSPDINIYANNLYLNVWSAYGDVATELSAGGFGNYWGHTTPPCFIAGADSSRADMVDSYASCQKLALNTIGFPLSSVGWYFFSIPFTPKNTSTANILGPLTGKYELLQSYLNGVSQKYIPGGFSTLTKMDLYHGYWLKVTSAPADLVVLGNTTSGCYPLLINMGTNPKHWVGYWVGQPKPVKEAMFSIQGNFEYIKTFKDGVWNTYMPGLEQFSDLKTMAPGFGYLIKMNATDTLDYTCG